MFTILFLTLIRIYLWGVLVNFILITIAAFKNSESKKKGTKLYNETIFFVNNLDKLLLVCLTSWLFIIFLFDKSKK